MWLSGRGPLIISAEYLLLGNGLGFFIASNEKWKQYSSYCKEIDKHPTKRCESAATCTPKSLQLACGWHRLALQRKKVKLAAYEKLLPEGHDEQLRILHELGKDALLVAAEESWLHFAACGPAREFFARSVVGGAVDFIFPVEGDAGGGAEADTGEATAAAGSNRLAPKLACDFPHPTATFWDVHAPLLKAIRAEDPEFVTSHEKSRAARLASGVPPVKKVAQAVGTTVKTEADVVRDNKMTAELVAVGAVGGSGSSKYWKLLPSKCWKLAEVFKKGLLRLRLPGGGSALQPFVGYEHDENQVLAAASDFATATGTAPHCLGAKGLSVRAFSQLGRLRAGPKLQLYRLLNLLHQGVASVNCEGAATLVLAVLWQTGPPKTERAVEGEGGSTSFKSCKSRENNFLTESDDMRELAEFFEIDLRINIAS